MTEKMNFTRLYKNHKNNKIGIFEIWTEHNVVVWEWAAGLNDHRQRKEECITIGKQGRSVIEQAFFRLTSKVNSKLDAGYVYNYDDALAPPTDANGQLKPMLAQKFSDYKKPIDESQVWIQPKYNGHRCLIGRKNDEIFAYSRNGKPMPGIPHILTGLSIPEGVTVDGEVYHHGWTLQQIQSYAKCLQPNSEKLQFNCYDVITNEVFSKRFEFLTELFYEGLMNSHCKRVPTKRLSDISDLNALFKEIRKRGYEGLMARLNTHPYEAGRRSESLLKIKQCHDAEFKVVDVIASKDGWGILICQIKGPQTFRVSAPGTVMQKEYVLKNKDKFIERLVTVEYSEMTADGVPFHPVAIAFREEI